MNLSLLDIKDLSVCFYMPEGVIRAVDGVSFDLAAGETLGLVGESGCGKSVTALSILGLIPSPSGRIDSGSIKFEGIELTDLDDNSLRTVRGRHIAMIFQEPMTSLNPVLPIGRQVAEPLIKHKNLSKFEAFNEAAAWLDRVKIPAARKRMNDYPHQLSGGMCQRVMIAMAMVCRPKLLIADEPTTALDVTIQAQILSLMTGLKDELDMSMLLISHDLGIVAQMASRVVVMYAGQVVEEARVIDIFDQPFHPYTRGLLKSIPPLRHVRDDRSRRLIEIPGVVPPLNEIIRGCRFAERCSYVFELCRVQPPEMYEIRNEHRARCWLKLHPEKRRDV